MEDFDVFDNEGPDNDTLHSMTDSRSLNLILRGLKLNNGFDRRNFLDLKWWVERQIMP